VKLHNFNLKKKVAKQMQDTTTLVFTSNEKLVSDTCREKFKLFRTEVLYSPSVWIIWKIRFDLHGTTFSPSPQHCHRTDAPWVWTNIHAIHLHWS